MLARRLPINTKTKQKLDSLFKSNFSHSTCEKVLQT